jgi:XRE family transcriptional regulator, fatty acid utilization regulator
MNQVELARSLGISTSYLNQTEHSRRPLTATVLLHIAEALGVDPEFSSKAVEERLETGLRTALGDGARRRHVSSGPSVRFDQAASVWTAGSNRAHLREMAKLSHRLGDGANEQFTNGKFIVHGSLCGSPAPLLGKY